MADFKTSLKHTLQYEGGYGNNPNDTGKETYRGVSRVFWPNWGGWRLIDQHKSNPGWQKRLDADASLQSLVEEFYRANFWNAVRGDLIANQAVADALFDAAVNLGIGRAIRYMQEVCGVAVDGKIGPATILAINSKADANGAFRARWKQHYQKRIAEDPKNEVFKNGWFRRAEGL